jgi:hypothetical protein
LIITAKALFAGLMSSVGGVSFGSIAKLLVKVYPKRTILGLTLMIAQAFFYNAVFFSYSLILLGILFSI